jgi:NAD(P)H dehydrogenase (quinone)
MNVLHLYCRPLEESFRRTPGDEVSVGLGEAGHADDLLDLNVEKFDPVLTADGRRRYLDTSHNQLGLEVYVARLCAADALILQFTAGAFGVPAMALYLGDPPRKIITRYLGRFINRMQCLALYPITVTDEARPKAFVAQLRQVTARF